MRRTKGIFTLCLISILALTGCGNQTTENVDTGQEIEENVEIQTEDDWVINDAENLTVEELQQKADRIYDAYNQGELTYEEAYGYLTENVESIPHGEKKRVINNKIGELEALQDSKKAYDAGLSYMDSGSKEDTVKAIIEFQKVIKEDTNYDNAQTNLAIVSEEYYSYMKETVDGQVAESEYVTAILNYKNMVEILGDYNDVEQEYEDLVNEYVTQQIAEAEILMQEGKFIEARNLINDCIDDVGETAELKDEKVRIEECTPVSLFTLNEFYRNLDDNVFVNDWDINDIDNVGNSGYEGLFVTYQAFAAYTDLKTGKISYLLEENYDNFSGKIALSESCKNKSYDDGYYTYIRVYGDDVLLYESDYLYAGVKPIEFNVNITNVDELVIEFNIHNAQMGIVFADPMLSKALQ